MTKPEHQNGEKTVRGGASIAAEIIGVPMLITLGSGVGPEGIEGITEAWWHCVVSDPTTSDLPPVEGIQARIVIKHPAASPDKEADAGCGAVRIVQGANLEQLSDHLTSALTAAAIENRAGDLLMLHAAGLADDEGRVLALVAASGIGKSTAAVALGQHLRYVTDETVAIDMDGAVVGYPKPVSLLGRAAGKARKGQIGPRQLDLKVAMGPLKLRRIALLDRDQTGDRVRPEISAVPLFDALLALIPQTSSLSRLSDPICYLMNLIHSCGGVWRVSYSEASSLVPLLTEFLQSNERIAYDWTYTPPNMSAIRNGVFLPAENHGTIWWQGEALVFLDDHIQRVRGIGAPIWRAVQDGALLVDIQEQVAEEFGRPDRYREMVNEALGMMVRSGLLLESQNPCGVT